MGLGAAALVAALSAPLAARPRDPLREWPNGPVRYLITRTETKRYRQLKGAEDQLDFIRRFWQRRDPNPQTPENEARAIFWGRVAEANRLFGFGGIPGWRTDRGKIYILLGPPEDIETKEFYDTGVRTIAQRGLLRWHYRGLANAPTRAATVVAFVRDNDFEWRLTADPRFSSPLFDINSPISEQSQMSGVLARLMERVPWGGGSLATAMDLGRLQEVPNERDLLRAMVSAEGFLGTLDGVVDWRILADRDGRFYLALTAAVPRAALTPAWDGSAAGLTQRFLTSGSLRAVDGPGERVIDLPEGSFAAEPAPAAHDPWLRFQSVLPLPKPLEGRWEASLVVLDQLAGDAAALRATIDSAPPARDAPWINGPILAAQLVEAPDAAAAPQPFRIGDALVIPRLDATHSLDEPFLLFVEILAPAGASTPVALDWRFERRAFDAPTPSPWQQPGHLDDGRGLRAWRLAPGALPPGEYTVHFLARSASGASTTRRLTFSVSAADAQATRP